MKQDCTLLLSTYDGGADIWEGFFPCLAAQWPELDLPIVMNTESKSYAFPGMEIRTLGLYPDGGKRVPWAKRLREHLKRIDTEFILLFLEDFWLEGPVDDAFFRQCLQWMRENPDVANLSFQPTPGPNIRDGRFARFERRPQDGAYRFNCQAALWRRERLIQFLRAHESPWEWEVTGSIRSQRYQDGFYSLTEGEKPVFPYNLDLGGVIHRGKWNREAVVPLAEHYGLSIDYSRRGFEDWEKYAARDLADQQSAVSETLWTKLTKPHLLRRLRKSAGIRWRRLRSLI